MTSLAAVMTGLTVATAVLAARGHRFAVPTVSLPRPRWLNVVEQQGVPAARFVAASCVGGVAAFVAVWLVTGAPLVAVVPAGVVATLPAGYYHHRTQQADKQRLEAWPDALRALSGSLSAGNSLHDSCLHLARSGPLPLREAWQRYEDLAKIMRPAEAFEVMRVELGHPVSDEVCEVLAAASTEGARNVVQILDDLAEATTASVQLAERIDTQRLQHRLNARAVFIVPWATLIFLASRPGVFRDYYSSPAAVPVLLLGAAMSLGGMVLVNRLGRIPTQPRVLAGIGEDQEVAPR